MNGTKLLHFKYPPLFSCLKSSKYVYLQVFFCVLIKQKQKQKKKLEKKLGWAKDQPSPTRLDWFVA